ncbi:N-acetyltransferase [Marinococcus halophilus]|uniref:N-acetyltransferase n=1 Tax=Marinococcus halophilus TaxID=1371 RepID=A0A510Y6R1_MARHA|nr:GNAT family N-acetyltransferase [Marinococcus halophilus]OZT79702.1 N-acetyltransferase [Marinococcus halophilus]GEK59058.1 N-acetyltransferase [Marinococcus halophilus]
MTFTMQQLTEEDIPELVQLLREVGWDYDGAEMKAVLAAGVVYGHKTPEGGVVSSAAVIPYGKAAAALGLVIVRKSCRRQGLAKEAVKACLNTIPVNAGVLLFATKEGKPLYQQLGFEEAGKVYKYVAPGQVVKKTSIVRPSSIRTYEAHDWNSLQQLDLGAFGQDRSAFLRHRITQAHQALILLDDQNHPAGFGLSIWHEGQLLLGPIAAPNEKAAAELLEQLIESHPVKVRIDLTEENRIMTETLRQCGFEKQSEPLMMARAPSIIEPRNGNLYAIASQIFG